MSVARARGDDPAAVPRQCAFAYRELRAADWAVTPDMCCGGRCDPDGHDACNGSMPLDSALRSLGCLATGGLAVINGAPRERLLIDELEQRRPVCGRISRGGSVGHFGVVVGMYTAPAGNVVFRVSDPLWAPGTVVDQGIESLRSNYLGKGGRWVKSYLTR